MRRLIVKRFESSFGAFKKTIETFIKINNDVLGFITKTGNGDVFKENIFSTATCSKIFLSSITMKSNYD